ncbi:hypothetical protein SAMN05216597_3859 [Pseudomonas cannabina]|nr:hypothetical protein SAMN05216597_3859 [Pseudomonas cannabina]
MGPRRYLDEAINNLADPSAPFVQNVKGVNLNLASYKDKNLSMFHAKQYAKLARQVSAGEISSTSAHFKSAFLWYRRLTKEGLKSAPVVGMGFNIVGGLASGPIEKNMFKTGEILRKNSSGVRRP